MVLYQDHYYPDYLITTIRVKDGKVSYANDKGNFVQIGGTADAATPDAGNDNVETPVKPDIPKTGDESHLVLWALLAVVSVAGIVVLRRRASCNL